MTGSCDRQRAGPVRTSGHGIIERADGKPAPNDNSAVTEPDEDWDETAEGGEDPKGSTMATETRVAIIETRSLAV